jgi:hypothetical protein
LFHTSDFPLHWREAAENVPVCVQNELQRVRAAVAAAVEFLRAETVACKKYEPFSFVILMSVPVSASTNDRTIGAGADDLTQ